MTIFVTGKNGFIAKGLIQKLLLMGHKINWTSHQKNKNDIFLNLICPENFNYELIKKGDVIIHLAAISSPDLCESNHELAYKINVKGTSHFLEKCFLRGAKVIFFSSDIVYGNEGCFNEKSKCNPFGGYGMMKHSIETKFINNPSFKILRLSYVFSSYDKYTSYLTHCSKNNEVAKIFHPLFRNIIYYQDVLEATEKLITNFDKLNNNIFNLCGEKNLSRKALAEIYKKIINKDLNVKIVNPGTDFFKIRPQKIKVKSLYLQELLNRKPLAIEKAMKIEFNKNTQ